MTLLQAYLSGNSSPGPFADLCGRTQERNIGRPCAKNEADETCKEKGKKKKFSGGRQNRQYSFLKHPQTLVLESPQQLRAKEQKGSI